MSGVKGGNLGGFGGTAIPTNPIQSQDCNPTPFQPCPNVPPTPVQPCQDVNPVPVQPCQNVPPVPVQPCQNIPPVPVQPCEVNLCQTGTGEGMGGVNLGGIGGGISGGCGGVNVKK
ncbi:amelogenin-like [Hyperolius riggenbachi]|uniref:amelogenin-like n=1 Tax=Hyperolius riggenbachi TaxID=752182 RepID=UPI0035A391BD